MLDIDKPSGRVTSARMAVSTGHKILDDSALEAFRKWRFKPGTSAKVKIPIAFSMSSGRFPPRVRTSAPLPVSHPVRVRSVSGGPDAIAIRTTQFDYPLSARSQHVSGNGAAIIEIDARSGTVVSARMNPSTGRKILDEAALKAFRQWRFKPGVGGKFKIPITYKMER